MSDSRMHSMYGQTERRRRNRQECIGMPLKLLILEPKWHKYECDMRLQGNGRIDVNYIMDAYVYLLIHITCINANNRWSCLDGWYIAMLRPAWNAMLHNVSM